MTAPLGIGIDPQPKRIGLALVTLDDEPRPLWADTFPLRGDGVKFDPEMGLRVRNALRKAGHEAERHGGEISRVGIERAIVGGANTSLATCWESGGVYLLAIDGCRRIWKDRRLSFVPLRPGQWKRHALGEGHGNDGKDKVAVWARRWAIEAGWDEVRMNGLAKHDATDALGIAVGGVVEGGPA